MSVAFYRFTDVVLEELLEEGVQVLDEYDPETLLEDGVIHVVYQPWDQPPLSQSVDEDGLQVLSLRKFIKETFSVDESEMYFLKRFSIDNNIEYDNEDISLLLKDASVRSFEELYDNYISGKVATVHVVDTDLKTARYMGKEYREALCKVFDTDEWINGDLVIVKKSLDKGGCNNSGTFVVVSSEYNTDLLQLDYTVDIENGSIPLNVVSDYPICHWASPFKYEGERFPMIKHNSLVFIETSDENVEDILLKRSEVISNVESESGDIRWQDRLIVFTDGNVRYGIICEYGMQCEPGIDFDDYREECDRILHASKTGFFIQYPRFKAMLSTSHLYSLVDKQKFMNNLVAYNINNTYKAMIDELVYKLGVAPNCIGFIDCGSL
jgi:hypothetical protein